MIVVQAPHAHKQLLAAPKGLQAALRAKRKALEQDPFHGVFVRLARVPSKTRAMWERRVGPVGNLFKIDLPQAWRALYTVITKGEHRIVMVLAVVDHDAYDRLLGYRTS